MDTFVFDSGKRGSTTGQVDAREQVAVQDDGLAVSGTGNNVLVTDGGAAQAAADIARVGGDLSARFIADTAAARRAQNQTTAELARLNADTSRTAIQAATESARFGQDTTQVLIGESARLATGSQQFAQNVTADALGVNERTSSRAFNAVAGANRIATDAVLRGTETALSENRRTTERNLAAIRDVTRQGANITTRAIDRVSGTAQRAIAESGNARRDAFSLAGQFADTNAQLSAANTNALRQTIDGALSFADRALTSVTQGFGQSIASNAATTQGALNFSRTLNQTADENIAAGAQETSQSVVRNVTIGAAVVAAVFLLARA